MCEQRHAREMRWRCKRSEEVDRTPAAAQPPPCPSYPGCSNRHSHVQGLFLYTHVSLDLHTQKASLCCCICTRTQGHATQYSPDSFSILVDIPVGTGQSVPAAKRSEKSRLRLGGPASPFPCACSTYMRVCVCCVCVCVCVCVYKLQYHSSSASGSVYTTLSFPCWRSRSLRWLTW